MSSIKNMLTTNEPYHSAYEAHLSISQIIGEISRDSEGPCEIWEIFVAWKVISALAGIAELLLNGSYILPSPHHRLAIPVLRQRVAGLVESRQQWRRATRRTPKATVEYVIHFAMAQQSQQTLQSPW